MPYLLATLYDDVAQIQHRTDDLFGSGRLIGRNLVLTARHVVTAADGSEPVNHGWQVRMISGRPRTPKAEQWAWIEATVVWTGVGSLDLALLKLSPEKGNPGWHPRLRLRIAQVDEVRDHGVRGLGFPRGARVDDKRTLFVPSGNLNDEREGTLSFGVDAAYVPESPNEDWRGFSGGSVLEEDSPDPDTVWIYGVAQQVPARFTRLLSVARLAKAWEDERFQAALVAAKIPLEPPADPTTLESPGLSAILSAHREDYLATYGQVAVLGDHPAEALDTFIEVPYLHRRFDVKAPAQIEGPPLTIDRVEPSAGNARQPAQQDENFLLERLRAGGSWILVEGEGGSGKTEFARHAVAQLIIELPDDLDRADRVPVFIELRALGSESQVQSPPALMAGMAEHAGNLASVAGDTTWFQQLAAQGRLVLVLDGLDEFPDFSRFDRFDRALEGARRQFGLDRCSVLVTGRPSAFALTPRLRHRAERLRFQPQPLTLAEVEVGIIDFFGRNRPAAASMIRAVQESRDSIQRLLGVPLFLTLACALWSHDEGTGILSDAAALMSNGLEHLLDRRLKGHVSQALDDLARLAASTCPAFDNIPHTDASRLMDEAALERYSLDSGILRGGVGTGYRFGIRPLAEYLAGRYFARGKDEGVMATFEQHVWSNRWREPLFWMAGELWKNSRKPVLFALLNRLLDEVDKGNDDVSETLFQRICDIVSASAKSERIPNAVAGRLSRLLIPVEKNPDAAGRIRCFEAEIGAWPQHIRDQLTRSALASMRKSYPHLLIQTLGILRCRQAIDRLHKHLKSEPQYVIPALGRIGTEAAVEILTRVLQSPESDEVQREYSATALGATGLVSAVPGLVRRLEVEQSQGVRISIYDALAGLGWPETVPRILQEIERERNDPETRFHPRFFSVLTGLASHSRDARSELQRFIHEETDLYLRYEAATALGLVRYSTVLIPIDIEDPKMGSIAATTTESSEVAGKVLSLTLETKDGTTHEREIGTILATFYRISVEPAASGRHTVNRYHLVRLDEDDPERTLETLEFIRDSIDEEGTLSSVAEAIGSCGSSRSCGVLVQFLRKGNYRDVLYKAVDALGDPSNRDAIPDLKKWLKEEDSDDDLSWHAAETLLKIDATDAAIVGACMDAELAHPVATMLRHHDHAAFCVPTRVVRTRFRGLPLKQQPLKSVRGSSCVVVPREALRLPPSRMDRKQKPQRA